MKICPKESRIMHVALRKSIIVDNYWNCIVKNRMFETTHLRIRHFLLTHTLYRLRRILDPIRLSEIPGIARTSKSFEHNTHNSTITIIGYRSPRTEEMRGFSRLGIWNERFCYICRCLKSLRIIEFTILNLLSSSSRKENISTIYFPSSILGKININSIPPSQHISIIPSTTPSYRPGEILVCALQYT